MKKPKKMFKQFYIIAIALNIFSSLSGIVFLIIHMLYSEANDDTNWPYSLLLIWSIWLIIVVSSLVLQVICIWIIILSFWRNTFFGRIENPSYFSENRNSKQKYLLSEFGIVISLTFLCWIPFLNTITLLLTKKYIYKNKDYKQYFDF